MFGLISRRRVNSGERGEPSAIHEAPPICVLEQLESRTLFTVLTFAPATGAWANYTPLPQTYGDRVTAATQNGFAYGTAGGTTPNVVAQYGATGIAAQTWDIGYGDLKNIVFSNPSGSLFQLTLTADTGFKVALSSFDMAGYHTDYTINNVKVADGTGKVLFTQSKVLIQGDTTGALHTHFALPSTVTAQVLKITFDSSNSGGFNVGMDNVQFSQTRVGAAPGTVSGTVFNDANANGKQDAKELGLAGWRVYADANNNGMYDSGELFALTDATGKYKLSLKGGNNQIISVQAKRGYYQTSPHALIYTVNINNNNLTGELFGVKLIAPA